MHNDLYNSKCYAVFKTLLLFLDKLKLFRILFEFILDNAFFNTVSNSKTFGLYENIYNDGNEKNIRKDIRENTSYKNIFL